MKKYKLIAFSLILTFMTMLSVSAREMTVKELGELANAQYAEKNQQVNYIYIIGEYAFTSQYDVKTEDIMLAASSINSSKDAVKFNSGSSTELSEDYKKMVIDTITAKINDNFEIEGWEVSKAAVGTSTLVSAETSEAKVKVRYIDYTFIGEPSKFEVADPSSEANNILETSYGWKRETSQNSGYFVKFENEGNTVKVSGLVPKVTLTQNNIFAAEHLTGYYFAYSLKIKAKNGTTIKLGAHNNNVDEEKTINVASDDDDYELVLLMHVHPNDTEKKVTITVDLDGEGNKEYAPYDIILDYSGLTLASETEPGETQAPTVSEEDKGEYYDFDSTRNEVTIAANTTEAKQDYDLTGTIKEQKVSEESGFGTDDGYYVVIRVNGPADSTNWTLGLHRADGTYYTYTPTKEEYEAGYVDVLFSVSRDGQEYSEDGEDKANYKKTLRYQIDADGACTASTDEQAGTGCEFDPVTVIIDYSNVTFKTATEVTFDYKYQDGETDKKEVVTYFEGDEISLKDTEETTTGKDEYHELVEWKVSESDSSSVTPEEEKIEIKQNQDDFTLEASWELNTEKFMEDIISEYSDSIAKSDAATDSKAKEFTASYEDQTITVTIPNENEIKVSELDNTIIPGVLKYILDNAEVEKITIGCGKSNIETTTEITKSSFESDLSSAMESFMTSLLDNLETELGDVDGKSVTFDDLFKISDFSFTFKLNLVSDSNVTIPAGKDTFTIKFAKAATE